MASRRSRGQREASSIPNRRAVRQVRSDLQLHRLGLGHRLTNSLVRRDRVSASARIRLSACERHIHERQYELAANLEVISGSAKYFAPMQVIEENVGYDIALVPGHTAVWSQLGIGTWPPGVTTPVTYGSGASAKSSRNCEIFPSTVSSCSGWGVVCCLVPICLLLSSSLRLVLLGGRGRSRAKSR
jgi:hypothetical protein